MNKITIIIGLYTFIGFGSMLPMNPDQLLNDVGQQYLENYMTDRNFTESQKITFREKALANPVLMAEFNRLKTEVKKETVQNNNT